MGDAAQLRIRGFPQGRYVRIRFKALPAEFVTNFRYHTFLFRAFCCVQGKSTAVVPSCVGALFVLSRALLCCWIGILRSRCRCWKHGRRLPGYQCRHLHSVGGLHGDTFSYHGDTFSYHRDTFSYRHLRILREFFPSSSSSSKCELIYVQINVDKIGGVAEHVSIGNRFRAFLCAI